MIHNQLNGEPLSPERIHAYLTRLGMEAPSDLNLDYLTRVQLAHFMKVPYENLSIMAGDPTSLDREDLYQKIVEQHRGGVCSELNAMYNWLLESLGYEVISYSCRITAQSDVIQWRSHRAMGVIIDGKTYVTDVGYNFEHARIPLLLEQDLVQFDGKCEYKLERDEFWGWLMWQKRPGCDWRKLLGFTEEPQIDLDFVPNMYYYDLNPNSRFNKYPKVSIYDEDYCYAIREHQYYVESCGVEVSVTPITSKEQEKKLLKEVFHLSMDSK